MRPGADAPVEIDALVEALQAARSPWEKVKVVARAWSAVRKLRPEERLLVARHVGLEGAETLVERLGDPETRPAAEELLEILRAADAEDLARWKSVVMQLRRPEERGELLRRGLEGARQALVEPAPPPPEEDIDGRWAGPERRAEAVPAAKSEPVAEALPVVETEPAAGTEPMVVRERAAAQAEPPVEEEPVEEEAAEPSSLEDLIESLEASDSLVERLRRFRSLLEQMRGLAPEELDRLLAALPEGWPRRRALVELLREGIPSELEQAAALVRKQEKSWDRLWCWSALMDSCPLPLSPEAARKLLAFEDAPALRRRLELRWATRSPFFNRRFDLRS